MLHFMRKHAKFFYVFFFLVIISFIFLYVGPIDRSTNPVLAEVGDKVIYLDEYWRAYDRLRNFYKEAYKERFNDEMEEKLNLKQSALDLLIEERLLLLKAEELGIRVSDNELQEAIMNEPAFMRDGVFRRDVYLRTLELNRLKPSYYEEMKRQELMLRKVRSLIEDTVILAEGDIKGLSGGEELFEGIRNAMISDKKDKVVKSYIETLKKRHKVKVYTELIS